MAVKLKFTEMFFPPPNNWGGFKKALMHFDMEKVSAENKSSICYHVREWLYYDAPLSVRNNDFSFDDIKLALDKNELPRNGEYPCKDYVECKTCKVFCTEKHKHCSSCNKPKHKVNINKCGKCDNCCKCKSCYAYGCKEHSETLKKCNRCGGCEQHCTCIQCGNTTCIVEASCEECGGCRSHCHCRSGYGEPVQATTKSMRKTFDCQRLVGIEWEINNVTPNKELYTWFQKWKGKNIHDGSCGREIITPPIAGDHIVNLLTELGSGLKAANAKANKKCSIHVHVDARDLEWKHIKTLVKVYSRIEPFLYFIGGPKRITSTYCKPCGSKYKNILNAKKQDLVTTEITNFAIGGDVYDRNGRTGASYLQSGGNKKAPGRYKGLNLAPWLVGTHNKRNDTTVEFRIHENTLDSKEVINWTMLCARLVDWVKLSTDDAVKELLVKSDSTIITTIAPEVSSWVKYKIKQRKKILTERITYDKGKFAFVVKARKIKPRASSTRAVTTNNVFSYNSFLATNEESYPF